MKNNDNYIEKIASYNEVICRLIYQFNISSLVKVMFIAFSVDNMEFYFSSSSQKYGLIDEIYEFISLGFQNKVDDFKYIFTCLDILERNRYIKIHDGQLKILKSPNFSKKNSILNSAKFEKIILDVNKLSELSFMKGVIENV